MFRSPVSTHSTGGAAGGYRVIVITVTDRIGIKILLTEGVDIEDRLNFKESVFVFFISFKFPNRQNQF